MWGLNILPDQIGSNTISHSLNKISITPKLPHSKLPLQILKLIKQSPRTTTFQYIYCFKRRTLRECRQKIIKMVVQHLHNNNFKIKLILNAYKQIFPTLLKLIQKETFSILLDPHECYLVS